MCYFVIVMATNHLWLINIIIKTILTAKNESTMFLDSSGSGGDSHRRSNSNLAASVSNIAKLR